MYGIYVLCLNLYMYTFMLFHPFSPPPLRTNVQLWLYHLCLIPYLAVPEEVYMAVRYQQQPDVFIW